MKAAVTRGAFLEVAEPRVAEQRFIYEQLQEPSIYLALSHPAAPTLAEVDGGRMWLVEEKVADIHLAHWLIIRQRESGLPIGFWVHYGWEHATDSVRELDLVIAAGVSLSLAAFVEAHLLVANLLLGQTRARRLRWRVRVGQRPLTWYARFGARYLGSLRQPAPDGHGEVENSFYELTRAEHAALLREIGLRPDEPLPRDLWQRLATRGSRGSTP